MEMVLFGIAALTALAVLVALVGSYICYRMAFFVKRTPYDPEKIELPEGAVYEPFHEKMEMWTRQTRALPREQVEITSFDGLKLTGYFYEFAPGAPVELMFHGYRGSAERDLSGGVQRCFQLGRSALIVDQRCSATSEGHVITMGIYEYRDCLAWIAFCLHRFGGEVKLILTGLSMGASTVLMAAGKKLPPNVIGVLADSGYTSPKAILCKCIRDMGLPPKLCYPFVRLGARLYGHFDPEQWSPLEAMKECRVPVIFFHGEADDFVPCDMSRENYEACAARKQLVTIPGAGHGLCYPVGKETYLKAVREFFGPEASFGGN